MRRRRNPFDKHAYVMLLQESKAYLGAAAVAAKKSDHYDELRNSIWRMSQSLHEIGKAIDLLGQNPAGVRETVRDLDALLKRMV